VTTRQIAGISLLLLFLALLGFLSLWSDGGGAPSKTLILSSSKECRECHPDVYAEWQASWHAKAWIDPLARAPDQSDNFKKKDCIPCHAPRPIFEVGFIQGQRVVERQANRQNGVDCISCHKLPAGGFAAPTPGITGPCNPQYHSGLSSIELCAPCHNQHNTVDEWVAAPAHLKGDNCNHCHYPEVMRPGRGGGPPREGRSHLLRGWRTENLEMEAFSFEKRVTGQDGKKVVEVRMINDKTPHNVPADSRNRALDLLITFLSKGGRPFPAADGAREFGQEPGTYRKRLRNPYRSEIGKQNTQIVAGTEVSLLAPVPRDAVRARIEILYKMTPFTTDEDAIVVRSETIDL